MSHGKIAWFVPLERFGDTYNGEPLGLAALASQKNHMALYLNNVYGNHSVESWFRGRWGETGKKLDTGKSCVRFRRLEDLPLDVSGETIARSDLEGFVAQYQEARRSSRNTRGAGPDSATGTVAPR